MLACILDLPIGIHILLTILSSLLALIFIFVALPSDLLWDRLQRRMQKKKKDKATRRADHLLDKDTSIRPLTDSHDTTERGDESVQRDDQYQSQLSSSSRLRFNDEEESFEEQLVARMLVWNHSFQDPQKTLEALLISRKDN